ncbi:MAG TPA: hypothetical protein DDY43_01100, partial [Synechococcales bacterium UBA10510]|nr:hypothetical protein [Synechococcales bacterium UBA10510]
MGPAGTAGNRYKYLNSLSLLEFQPVAGRLTWWSSIVTIARYPALLMTIAVGRAPQRGWFDVLDDWLKRDRFVFVGWSGL